MNDAQRVALVRRAAERAALLGRALAVRGPDGNTALGRMRDAQPGLRARSYEPRSHTMRHDATFAAVDRADPAVADERHFDDALRTAAQGLQRAWEIIAHYPPARSANDADRLALRRDNAPAEPFCENCARIPAERGGARREPPHPKLTGPTTVSARLDEARWLCSWCYERTRAWGRVPSIAELTRHHQGRRVDWPADVEPTPSRVPSRNGEP